MSSDKVLYVNPETKDVIATGNVGIGTTQPLAKLHVNGTFYAPGSVVQVVMTDITTVKSTTSTSFVTSDISGTISPKFATSKLIVTMNVSHDGEHSANYSAFYTQIRRDGVADTSIATDTNSAMIIWNQSVGATLMRYRGRNSISRQYSAISTAATIFTLFFRTIIAGNVIKVGTGGGIDGVSDVIIYEIAQ